MILESNKINELKAEEFYPHNEDRSEIKQNITIDDHIRLKLHFNQTPLGIIEWDKNFNVISWNPAAEKIFGYSSEEAIGKSGFNFLLPEAVKNTVKIVWEQLLKQKGGTRSTNKNITKEGKQILCDWYNTPLISGSGEVIGVSSFVDDITIQEKTRKIQSALYKISEAVNKFDNINELYKEIHHIIEGLMKAENFYIAYYKEQSGMLTFPYFVDEIDSAPSEAKFGRGLTEYVIRKGESALVDIHMDAYLNKIGEVELTGPQSQIWLGVPLKIKDKTIGAMVVQDYHDKSTYGEGEKQVLIYVSEQVASAISKKINETALKKYSEELQELNQSKDKFFSIIAHDLRSPFYGLLGLTKILKNEYDSLPSEETKVYLDELFSATSNIYTLIENLLEWSRIQTGKLIFRPENFDFKELLDEVATLLHQTAKLKSISIENCIDECLLISADRAMIRSLMQNLISNAIKFTKPGGSVKISCTISDNKNIEIVVQDNGIGMDAEKISNLFKIDKNTSSTGTSSEKGTGLGLLICKEIIEKHNGQLNINSEIGKGTCISFELMQA